MRPLSARQLEQFQPVSASALTRCGLDARAVDWYVQAGRQPNACAAGRRTVAVTQGALDGFLAARLPGDLLAAVLIHELGHHATRAGRVGLASAWFTAPGRLAFRLVVGLAVLVSGGRRPGRETWLVVAVGGAVAIAHTAQQARWLSTITLAAVAFTLVLAPLLDALISRASEHAADRYAVSVGAGPDLARALLALTGPVGSPRGTSYGLLDRHPSLLARLRRIDSSLSTSRGRTQGHSPTRSG